MPNALVGAVIRTVSLGGEEEVGFCDNTVVTSKYTVFTFVPLNLFEQFHKAANVYFMVISIVMYISEVTDLYMQSIKAYSTFLTLVVMMLFSAILAAIDDWRRHLADKETNNSPATIIDASGNTSVTQWNEIRVGNFLLIKQNEQLPADIVPLACSGEEGACYVSTMNLDGETNLKTKAAVECTQALLCGAKVGIPSAEVLKILGERMKGQVEAEAPQRSIHNFSGSITIKDQERAALGAKEFLLRGTVLRNTTWAIGVVVYTGKDTRVVMNSRKTPIKVANIERVINVSMLVILATQFTLALISDIAYCLGIESLRGYWYLFPAGGKSLILFPEWLGYLITFFVLYSNLMPISLYATLELCNSAQASFIKNDPAMFDDEFKVYANVRASNLTQEIGQVEYIFSDKTGTLTQNIMDLKRLYIAGAKFGEISAGRGFTGGPDIFAVKDPAKVAARERFFEVLSVSHTVVVSQGEGEDNGKYEAESPDELSLVTETGALGWKFTGKAGPVMSVAVTRDGKTETRNYKIIAVNVFNSTRKRMSMVVQNMQNHEYVLLCKGADNVMLERAAHQDQQMEAALTIFAKEGLRTLVIANKILREAEVTTWMETYKAAQTSMTDREQALMDAAEQIETGMTLLGATAIEDKLQEDVGGTIVRLRHAGIKLWVLTGDKLETAKEIGFSTKVLNDEMTILLLDLESGDNKASFETKLQAMAKVTEAIGTGSEGHEVGMMVTGAALELLMGENMHAPFLSIARKCSVLIACRVSPLQKALMVKLVREGVKPTPVTLAVGDGANDVPMIQEAQVGVGIYGREGRQAVNSADFAIAQFRFLQRLLLVHGRFNYRRTCKFTLYTFWRNAMQVLLMFFYSFLAGQSGITLFEDKTRITFNFVLAIPIIAVGIFDCDVAEEVALDYPALYETGRCGMDLGPLRIAVTLFNAFVYALVVFIIAELSWTGMGLLGKGDYYVFGTMVYTCMIICANCRAGFITITWNKMNLAAIGVSLVMYLLFLLIYGALRDAEPPMYMVPYKMFGSAPFWLCIFVMPLACVALDSISAWLYMTFFTELKDRLLTEAQIPLQVKKPPVDPPLPTSMSSWKIAYVQERLISKELRFTKRGLGLCVSVVGFLLMLAGIISLASSQATAQLRITYDGQEDNGPTGTVASERMPLPCKVTAGGVTTSCTFSITMPATISRPLLAYMVTPFYQNFNAYVLSKVNKEVVGGEATPTDLKQCKSTHADVTNRGLKAYPCGLRSIGFFNDTFEILGREIETDTVAWASDTDNFKNPADYGIRAGTSFLADQFPKIIGSEGVKNPHYAAWYRPAALPNVIKRYGTLPKALQKGELITLRINSSFPVYGIDASKQLIITTLSGLGGRDDSLGLLLVISGAVLIVLGIVMIVFSAVMKTPPLANSKFAKGGKYKKFDTE